MLDGGTKKSLISIMDDHREKIEESSIRGKAKILKFKSDSEEDKKEEKKSFSNEEKVVEGESKGTSLFILEEKRRLEKSQYKLKSKEVLNLYKKSSELNISEERATRDDLSKSNKVGVLVNKRQY